MNLGLYLENGLWRVTDTDFFFCHREDIFRHFIGLIHTPYFQDTRGRTKGRGLFLHLSSIFSSAPVLSNADLRSPASENARHFCRVNMLYHDLSWRRLKKLKNWP